MEKATLGFRVVYKIWQILKRFTGTFRRAQTLKLGGVIGNVTNSKNCYFQNYNWNVTVKISETSCQKFPPSENNAFNPKTVLQIL